MVDVSRGTNVNVALRKTLSETITVADNNCRIKSDYVVKTSIATDFSNVLADVATETLWLRRETSTQDSAGDTASYSETRISTPGRIMPLSEKDRNIDGIGTIITGDMIGYFEPIYTDAGTDYEITEGDQIERDDGTLFRVQKIVHRQTLGEVTIYIKTYLRRLE